MTKSQRILALDYGLKRVGVAISAPLNMFATPLDTLNNNSDNKSEKQLLDKLSEIILSYDVKEVVIGLPRRTTGQEGVEAKRVRDFAEKLALIHPLIIHFEDERFTSTIANQVLREGGKKPSRDKGMVDQTAACLILNAYLERQRQV